MGSASPLGLPSPWLYCRGSGSCSLNGSWLHRLPQKPDQFSYKGDHDHLWRLSFGQGFVAFVQTFLCPLADGHGLCTAVLLSFCKGRANPGRVGVFPGCPNQSLPHLRISGLRDGAGPNGLSRGMLRGDQFQIGCQGGGTFKSPNAPISQTSCMAVIRPMPRNASRV